MIRARVAALALYLLGRNVVGRADGGCEIGIGQACARAVSPAMPKSMSFTLSAAVHHDVFGFQVAMNHAVGMDVFERLQYRRPRWRVRARAAAGLLRESRAAGGRRTTPSPCKGATGLRRRRRASLWGGSVVRRWRPRAESGRRAVGRPQVRDVEFSTPRRFHCAYPLRDRSMAIPLRATGASMR